MAGDNGPFRRTRLVVKAIHLVAQGRAELAGTGTTRVKGNVAGIIAMLIGTAAFVCGDATMKVMSAHMPVGETMAIRGVIAAILVWSIAFWSGAAYHLSHHVSRLLAFRTGCEVGSAMTFQNALARLPFTDVGSFLQINPLVVTAGAALVLKEKVGWRRWTATGVGLLGALLIIRPGGASFQWASLLLLATILFSTSRDLATRRLAPGIPAIVITALSITAIMLSGFVFGLSEVWRRPTLGEVVFLGLPAIFSLIGQFAVVLSIRAGDVSAVVPFRYAAILWTLLLGFLIWRELPDPLTLTGIAIVVSAGIYTIHREQTLRREAARRAADAGAAS